jgi:hypothetical protein
LLNKPFWIWDQQQHKLEDTRTNADCCFNHIIGLPRKEEVDKPIFDYEKLLYDSLLISDFKNSLNHYFKNKQKLVSIDLLSLRDLYEDKFLLEAFKLTDRRYIDAVK